MDRHPDGLNFVPSLVRSPSTSLRGSRSRLGLTAQDFQQSLAHYNGNYEGDITMFGDRKVRQRLPLESCTLNETDSETELRKDLEVYKGFDEKKALRPNLLWLFVTRCMLHFLPPDVVVKMTQQTQNFVQSPLYVYLKICGKYCKVAFYGILRLFMFVSSNLGIISLGLWRCRTILRNITRRLLWWLTLAKCGDLTLFTIILLCTPWLFLFAALGFILSLYCSAKDYVRRSGIFLHVHKLV